MVQELIPRVFVSYSHDSEMHRARVLGLAERLRTDGIDVVLDQYIEGTPPNGWPRWMLDQIETADFVLLICTERYYLNFRGRETDPKGKGVDWEGALVTQAIYEQNVALRKFVPLLFDRDQVNFIPEPVRAMTSYTITSEVEYVRLYDFLLGRSGVEPAMLGNLKERARRRGESLRLAAEPAVGGGDVGAFASSPIAAQARGNVRIQSRFDFARLRQEVLDRRANARHRVRSMFFAGQHRELTTWHIFNFPREIQMGDVYVREIFREQTRGILLPVERSSPPIAEAELLESLLKPRLSDARQRLCIIQGNPGAGKSTLLRNWTLQLLAPKEDQVLPVPILIPLRSVSRALCAAALDEFVPDILSDAVSSSFFDVPKELSRIPFDYAASLRSAQSPSWLTQTIKRKRPQAPEWLLLFDGLDELDQRFHQTFLRWVRELPEPFTTIISTRRSANASTLTLSRHYEICDFDEDQIASFLLQWFRQQPEIAQNLCGVIKTKPAIREVCKVPLLVTCLAADVELRGDSQLDPNLDEPHLYRRAAEILLVDWDAHKHGIKASRALISAAFKTLGKLAATTAFDSDVSHDDLSSLCREFARDSNNSTAETIVEALISNGRILTGSAEFGYSFSHKAFYDYFLSLSLSE